MSPEHAGLGQSGKLTPKALKKALYWVESNRCVGNIHVSKGDDEKHFYFTVGGIRLLTSGTRRKIPLGKLLVRYGKVTPGKMREALINQKRSGRRIGDVLTKVMKVVKPQDIEEVVQIQVENEIFDVIAWEDGVFEFTASMPDALFNKKLKATTLSTDISDLMDRIRGKIDAWGDIKKRVPDLGGIYRLTRTGHRRLIEEGEAGPAQKELASFLDGNRSLGKLVDEGEFGTYEACEMVSSFLEKDWVRRVGGALDTSEVSDASNVFEEVQMLERALDLNPSDQTVRIKLVEALVKGGVRDRAGMHLRKLGEEKLRDSNPEDAQAFLEKAIKLNPTDFEGHEKLFEVYTRTAQREKAIAHGLRLGETYKANRLFNRTKNVLTRIIDWVPRNIKAHSLLAETHEELQETQSAVREFETVASILKGEGKDETRLKEIYERILQVDAKHKMARRELNRILRKGSKEIARILRAVALLLLACLAFGFVGYEFVGRDRYGEVRAEVYDHVGKKDFHSAGEAVDEFQSLFPFVGRGKLNTVVERLEKDRNQFLEREAGEPFRGGHTHHRETPGGGGSPRWAGSDATEGPPPPDPADDPGLVPGHSSGSRHRLRESLSGIQAVEGGSAHIPNRAGIPPHPGALRGHPPGGPDFPEWRAPSPREESPPPADRETPSPAGFPPGVRRPGPIPVGVRGELADRPSSHQRGGLEGGPRRPGGYGGGHPRRRTLRGVEESMSPLPRPGYGQGEMAPVGRTPRGFGSHPRGLQGGPSFLQRSRQSPSRRFPGKCRPRVPGAPRFSLPP
jgi:tetratricopeptide (TPR) repeat protein